MKRKYLILSILGITFMGFWMIGGSLMNSGMHPMGILGVPLFISQSFQDQVKVDDASYQTEQSFEVKVTGPTALRICDALEIVCSNEYEFDGIYWPGENITTVTYSKDGVENYFSIKDEESCQQLEVTKSCVPKITLTEKYADPSLNGNLVTLTVIPEKPGIEDDIDHVSLRCPDGEIDRDGQCVINPNCKSPFFITINGKCVTDKSSPECYPNFPDDRCRVLVECDVPFESGMPLPQCMPLADCPKGFLFSIFPVDGNDAICERTERYIGYAVFSTYDNKILRGDGVSFPLGGDIYDGAADESQLADALDIAAAIPDETAGNLRIFILVNGWYEQLGNPNVTLINPLDVEVENPFVISINDEPGLTTFGYDTTIPSTAETGTWQVRVSLDDFDDPPIQSFRVINSGDVSNERK